MPNKKDSLPLICDQRSLSAFLGWPLLWLMYYWDKKRIPHSPSRLTASQHLRRSWAFFMKEAWGHKELDTTERLNRTELNWTDGSLLSRALNSFSEAQIWILYFEVMCLEWQAQVERMYDGLWSQPILGLVCLPGNKLLALCKHTSKIIPRTKVTLLSWGNGNPQQYTCLKNPMDGGAWQATVHREANSHTWLSG